MRSSKLKIEAARRLRRSMTLAEFELWKRLRNRGCGGYRFRRQHVLHGFIVDFYCRELGLAIEIDGDVHDEQQGYDRERDEVLRLHGVRVIRFRNEEVLDDAEMVLRKLISVAPICKEAAWSQGLPEPRSANE